jgi:hypothetical protein
MKNFTLLFLFFVSWSSLAIAQDALHQSKSGHHSREKKSELTKDARTNIITPSLEKSVSSSVFNEGFENWNTQSPGQLPAGWTQFRTSTLNSNPTQQPDNRPWVANNPNSDVFGDGTPEDYVYSGDGSMVIGYNAGDGSALGRFTWAVTPSFTVSGGANDYAYLTYYKWFQHNADEGWFSSYHVKIFADGVWTNLASFVGPDAEANLFDDFVGIEISQYINKSVKIAFVYEYTDGYQMAIDEIDVVVLLNHDNGIASVAYDFYRWWPISVDKTMGFDIRVNGMGLIPIEGMVSLYVNDQLQDSAKLEALIFGMNTDTVLVWTPKTHGTFTVRIQLSNEVTDADGATVPDQNLANNALEFEIFIRDPQTVFFSEGFEHVDWEHADGPTTIFPPSENWSYTEGWMATVSRSIRDIISAAVYQVKDDAPELLVTPALNLPAGNYILEMLVGGLNNGITDDGVYFGHSILKVYLTTELVGKSVQEEILLLTHSLENGDATRKISLNLDIETDDEYYLIFETTSTFSFEDFASAVFIDNIHLFKPALFQATFNVDMTDAEGFDPATHKVYLTGTMTDWAIPGTENAIELTRDASINDSVVFTATIDINEGLHSYKYYSDLVGAGFDGGEWDGDPNRTVRISGNHIENDIWGILSGVSVNEPGYNHKLVLYPNPVRQTLIIDNDEIINHIRIFDITGRVVYSNTINDLNHQINVSEFTKGMYVLQVMSGNEIISRKFNVVK